MTTALISIITGIVLGLFSLKAKPATKALFLLTGIVLILLAPWADIIRAAFGPQIPTIGASIAVLFVGVWVIDTFGFIQETTDPWSTDWVQYYLFGYFKHDDFIIFRLIGLAVCCGALAVLVSAMLSGSVDVVGRLVDLRVAQTHTSKPAATAQKTAAAPNTAKERLATAPHVRVRMPRQSR